MLGTGARWEGSSAVPAPRINPSAGALSQVWVLHGHEEVAKDGL